MAKKEPMLLGDCIKERRESLGLSQKKLSEIIKVSPPAIHQYEKNTKTPSTEILLRLANALEVSVDYLLGKRLDPGIFVDVEVSEAFNIFSELPSQQRQYAMEHIRFLKAQEDKKSD